MKTAFLLVILSLTAFAQVRTQVNPLEQASREVFQNFVDGKENQTLFAEFVKNVEVVVTQELIAEAETAKLEVTKYLETEASLNKFQELTMERTSNLENVSNARAFLNLLKIGIRLNMQENVRFPPSNYFDVTADVRYRLKNLERKLQFYVNPLEDRLNAVIEALKKDEALIGRMRAAGSTAGCSNGDAVNPFTQAVAQALVKGGTYKAGDRSVVVPADPNWGVLTKDTRDGGEQNVVDKVAYRNSDNSLAFYDVVMFACGNNPRVPVDNFNKVSIDDPGRYHFKSVSQPTRRNGAATPRGRGRR